VIGEVFFSDSHFFSTGNPAELPHQSGSRAVTIVAINRDRVTSFVSSRKESIAARPRASVTLVQASIKLK
jgi:hypothetical protein